MHNPPSTPTPIRSSGRYLSIGGDVGEPVRAYLPDPLPPSPPLHFPPRLIERINDAHLAIGRLDSVALLLPQTDHFLYMYVRKEALLSSQIEGTQSSLSDLLLYESDEAPGVPLNDVREVSRYVHALQHAVGALKRGMPISNRLLRETHGILMRTGFGSHGDPGEFRRTQDWLGGSRPGNAAFVPPPSHELAQCMSDLERWMNNIPERTPTLVKAGLAHVQFETIHPFLDGNGRLGRMLITLLLVAEGMISEPLLYVSLWLKKHRRQYYELLSRVRTEGVWEEWLDFFVEGVEVAASEAVSTAKRLAELVRLHRNAIEDVGRTSGNLMRIHTALLQKPVASAPWLVERSGLSAPTVNRLLDVLTGLGIVAEITGRERGRLFSYATYVEIMSKDTEPLPR